MLAIDGVELLDVREAARLADRTPETVRRWIWSGRLAAQRHGNRLLVSRHDLESVVRGGLSAAKAVTLSEWARLVGEQRRSGALGSLSPDMPSAADLVLDDRHSRQAG